MTYQVSNISAITDIPALIGSFANSIGWTTNLTNPNEPEITHPSLVGAIPFKVSASISGLNNQLHEVFIEAVGHPEVTSLAQVQSPRLAGSSDNPTVPAPIKLHLFGALTPEPYVAAVIEYNGSLFRHLYLGNLEKLGSFTGGEVISGSMGAGSVNSSSYDYTDPGAFKFLFGGHNSQTDYPASISGGAHIEHVDNPEEWRVFSYELSLDSFDGTEILGGFSDGINEGYLARGESSYAGANILAPINLYVSKPVSGDAHFIPVGRPAGVRNVHMQSIDPGDQVVLGPDTWMCFPAAKKNSVLDMTGDTPGGFYRDFESTGYIGHAYLM